jgi:hypothetical protein
LLKITRVFVKALKSEDRRHAGVQPRVRLEDGHSVGPL